MGPIHAQKAYIVVSGHDLQFCFAQKQERLESRVECKMTSSDKKKEELPQIQFLFFFLAQFLGLPFGVKALVDGAKDARY